MEQSLVLDGPYKNKDFFNFISTSEQPRHQWYYFKEGFSSALVKEAIGAIDKKKPLKILDPFSGSGTTALTSSLLGHAATGIEVNPFLHFTSEIKTKAWAIPYDKSMKDLNEVLKKSRSGAFSALEGFSTFTAKEGLDKWLFNTSVIRRYTSVINAIDKCVDEEQKPLFRFAALIAAMDCANVKKDGKGVRYKKNWKDVAYAGSDFERNFSETFKKIASDINSNPITKKHEPKIFLSDSRGQFLNPDFKEDNYDLVITSPPYLNSFDYTDIYRPELFLGGFIRNNEELRELRLKTLRSHVQVDWNPEITYVAEYLKKYHDIIVSNKDQLWNKRIPVMIEAYFDDLAVILKNVKERMRKGGQVWLVVSTSAYAGVHIPVDLIIGEIGHELGLRLKGIHCLRYLRTSSQQYTQLQTNKAPLRESLIILEKA
ncbi:MAG: DNA methyltransferase [Mucilaginibacter sp.]